MVLLISVLIYPLEIKHLPHGYEVDFLEPDKNFAVFSASIISQIIQVISVGYHWWPLM